MSLSTDAVPLLITNRASPGLPSSKTHSLYGMTIAVIAFASSAISDSPKFSNTFTSLNFVATLELLKLSSATVDAFTERTTLCRSPADRRAFGLLNLSPSLRSRAGPAAGMRGPPFRHHVRYLNYSSASCPIYSVLF